MEEVIPQTIMILGIPVRDTVVSTWVTMAFIVILVWLLRKTLPTSLEMFIEFMRDLISNVLDGLPADPYLPFIGTLAVFLIVANNISVVPVLVSPTRDINTPLALAILVFFAVHYFGIRRKGLWGYLKKQLSPLIVLDIVGQVSRTMSLSLRLFGNMIAGEIIVAVIYRLVKPIAPLPLIALGLITGVLQAYVFVMLATSAIAAAVRDD
ncbi:MAG TPA: ATP synthase F0 subunit A [Chloroflexi bacterium]|nr:ATP synthase F0 subunit A [Chloroflexota bacterium]